MSCSPIRATSPAPSRPPPALWRWHACEEIEHKGVAYDTWLHATRHWPRSKRWKVKAKVMLFVTRNFVVDRTAGALELLRQDGITGPKGLVGLLWYMWVRPGMFRKIAGAWAKFFLPGFHPWNEDDRALIAPMRRAKRAAAEGKRKVARARKAQKGEAGGLGRKRLLNLPLPQRQGRNLRRHRLRISPAPAGTAAPALRRRARSCSAAR
jgi:hypothetical protein